MRIFFAALAALLVVWGVPAEAQFVSPPSGKTPYLARATSTFTTDATSTTGTVYQYKLTGGGGGAGGTNSSLASAAGAGGGGTCIGSFSGVAPGATVTVSIGTGGTAGASTGTDGTDGGSSTIAASGITTITATGGIHSVGATTNIVTSHGLGGSCTTGTNVTSLGGGAGNFGQVPASGQPISGQGGGSFWGPGGANANPSIVVNGSAGTAPGSGGGGGAGLTSAGGAGANGAAEITWVSVQ